MFSGQRKFELMYNVLNNNSMFSRVSVQIFKTQLRSTERTVVSCHCILLLLTSRFGFISVSPRKLCSHKVKTFSYFYAITGLMANLLLATTLYSMLCILMTGP